MTRGLRQGYPPMPLLVHHGLRPCVQMVGVSRYSIGTSSSMVSPEMCLRLRRRFCSRHRLRARCPLDRGVCLRDDQFCHGHVPEPQNVQLDPVKERDYPAAFWFGSAPTFLAFR